MAIEKSPYEKTFTGDTGSSACLGRIVAVNVEARTCQIKTIGSKHNDLDLHDVQWISTTASVTGEGSEDTCIPEIGQQGVVIFVGNAPYIVGFYRPLQAQPEPNQVEDLADPNLEQEGIINPGDRILKTVAGNKIILYSGGAIAVESNGRCKTLWSPAQNRISTTCNNHELETSGGYEYWREDELTGDTLKERLTWENLQPATAIRTQEGASDTGAILRVTAGEINEELEILTPAYDYQLDAAGKEIKKLDLLSVEQVGLDGAAYTTSKDPVAKQAVFSTPSGHSVVFDDGSDGGISIIHKTGASIQITGTGDIILQTGSGHTVTFAETSVGLTSKAGGTVSVSDKIVISDKSGGQIITLDDSGVNVTASKTVIVSAPTVMIQGGAIDLGKSPSFHAVLYEMLETIFDGHIHATAVGPSGPPLPPMTMAIMGANPVTSAKATNVKVRGNLTP